MFRKLGYTFFGSCLADGSKLSAKAIMLSIKNAPLSELRQTLTDDRLSARTDDGITPVLAACIYGREDVLAWLVTECKESLYIRDNLGNGPVELAIKHGRHGILQIDFAFSYRRNKFAVPFVMSEDKQDKHVAPERINYVVDAHTAQDVWSIGTTLETYVKSQTELFDEVLKSFPSIELFITISRCVDYRTRPTLPDFIKILTGEINKFNHQLRFSI